VRILFTLIGNSRRSNYLTGSNLRTGGAGGSGTDTSTILIAEYFASKGHEVTILMDDLEPALKKDKNVFNWGMKDNGVVYSNFNLDGVQNKEFDILVNSLWFDAYRNLPVKIKHGLIYWCHMQWLYGMGEIINFARDNSLKLGFVHISNWEKQHTSPVIENIKTQIENTFETIIPNPVFDEMIEQVKQKNIIKKPHKFIFHASWPRGGNVAVEAVRQLAMPKKEFHAFDYLMVIHDHKDSFFHIHNGVDKNTLFEHLAESEYFIYPLYTPYEDVHKDTFSCVVAEALAFGVNVLTYPLGALPEYFDGHVHWLDMPAGTNKEKMQLEPLSKDLQGDFKVTSNIVHKILQLEHDGTLKTNMMKSSNYILDNFNLNKVGSQWDSFLKNFL
jgi:hypothetical protein